MFATRIEPPCALVIDLWASASLRTGGDDLAQALWYLGPVVVLLLFLLFEPLGVLGARLVFAHLVLVALGLTFARSKMKESVVWEEAKAASARGESGDEAVTMSHGHLRELFTRKHIGSMMFLIGMYGFWNLWAGTNGFFFPYILQTVGAQSQTTSVLLQTGGFILSMISIAFVFMPLVDKVNQRTLFAVSAIVQIAGMALLALFPLTVPVAIAYIVLLQFGGGFGAQSFFQLWSAELFPTLLRSTAQGITFAFVRIFLGCWSFFVPLLTATGFTTLAWILTGFLVMSGVIGWIWAPRHEGKSLDDIQREQAAVPA